jgi:hypothetical protein
MYCYLKEIGVLIGAVCYKLPLIKWKKVSRVRKMHALYDNKQNQNIFVSEILMFLVL